MKVQVDTNLYLERIENSLSMMNVPTDICKTMLENTVFSLVVDSDIFPIEREDQIALIKSTLLEYYNYKITKEYGNGTSTRDQALEENIGKLFKASNYSVDENLARNFEDQSEDEFDKTDE